MPVFVPVLRLGMVFLNIYDSFKTLKMPPSSARNNGQPSVRAMAQRKRDMKGCLAVWIVWCCLTAYERLFEGIVSLFIPFYSEFKALVLLFLILTRARGAEPIYLHIIRPFLKPYASTLDIILEVAHFCGEIVLLIGMFPVHLLESARRKWTGGLQTESESSSEEDKPPTPKYTKHNARSDSAIPRYPSNLGAGRSAPRSVSAQQLRPERVADHTNRRASAGTSHIQQQQRPAPRLSPSRHQIWYPPPEAYDNPQIDGLPATDDPPMYFASQTDTDIQIAQDLEWRQYPPFPSAYPPTPIAPTSKRQLGPDSSQITLTSIQYPPSIAEEEQGSRQDFHQSLSPVREPSNPGSVSSLSDSDNVRVHNDESESGYISSTSSLLIDGEGDAIMDEPSSPSDVSNDEEDAFNVTLRTPLSRPLFLSPKKRKDELMITPSRTTSQSTSLDTFADDTSSLRTNSPPPVLGQKRSLTKVDESDDDDDAASQSQQVNPLPLGELSSNTSPSLSKNVLSKRQTRSNVKPVSGTSSADDDTVPLENSRPKRPEPKRRKIVPPIPTRVTRGSSKSRQTSVPADQDRASTASSSTRGSSNKPESESVSSSMSRTRQPRRK